MAKKKKPRLLDVGPDGEVRLPPDVIEAIQLKPGEQIEIQVDVRRQFVRIERHVDDPWGEATKESDGPSFQDLMDDHKSKAENAKRAFEDRLKEAPEEFKRRPEDDPEYWR